MNNLNYGIIGNCRSAALISEKGSIEWCCLPEFDSSSVFAKLLDKQKGGSFEIQVDEEYEIIQEYIRDTNILVTKFKKGNDYFEVVDFMPRYYNDKRATYSPPDIIRYIKHKSGAPTFRIKYDPKLEYAEYPTYTLVHNKYIKSYTKKGTYDSIYLYTSLNKNSVVKGEEITLTDDEFFLISYNQKILRQDVEHSYLKLQRTKVYWLNWSERTYKFAQYNSQIKRSALALKLLSYDKTGAVLAAVTTSLPEALGEIRNWDYRYCWLRDASMVVKVMTRLGHTQVAQKYMDFLIEIIPDKDERIQIMYGINGEKKLTEKVLKYLDGYENSKPVRIGNDAYKQKQNDIYGILMDVIYQQFQVYDITLDNSEALWTIIRSIVKVVEKNWKKPDRGIWELRTDQKHFTFSKVLSWVAIDRAVKIAKFINNDNEYIEQWSKIRDAIKKDILKKAWNEELGAFSQSYGSSDLDAANLLMEPFDFIEADDPKYISTVYATQKYLSKEGLMYRYRNEDDFGIPTSSFTICTFWLIEALFKIGEQEQSKQLFDRVLSYSNHLGLFSEDIEFKTKRLLGNFPQAYPHLALIETAIILSGGEFTREQRILQSIH